MQAKKDPNNRSWREIGGTPISIRGQASRTCATGPQRMRVVSSDSNEGLVEASKFGKSSIREICDR